MYDARTYITGMAAMTIIRSFINLFLDDVLDFH